MNTLYYHSHCVDGITAAEVMIRSQLLGEYPAIAPAVYGYTDFSKHFEGESVWFVDFCPQRDEIIALISKGVIVTIIDHHKTAMENLRGLSTHEFADNLNIIMDMSHSGAVLAFMYCKYKHLYALNPSAAIGSRYTETDSCILLNIDKATYLDAGDVLVPLYLRMVEDRDLWNNVIPDAIPYSIGLRNTAAFKNNNILAVVEMGIGNPDMMRDIINHGKTIVSYTTGEVNRLLYTVKVYTDTLGNSFSIGNVPEDLASDFGSAACKEYQVSFSITYNIIHSRNSVKLNLRSTGENDVSRLARLLGGGGHANASGVMVQLDKHPNFVNEVLCGDGSYLLNLWEQSKNRSNV